MGAQVSSYIETFKSVLLLTMLFYGLERLRPAESGQRFSDRTVNYIYLPFVLAWVLVLQMLLTPWHVRLLGWARGGLLAGYVGHGVWAEVTFGVLFAVTWDVWQYWIHRAQHQWPVLWETHKFHHSETALNSSTQARHQLLSYVVYMVGYAPMLLIFGGGAPNVVVVFLMFRVWGFVNHANVRINFGPLTSVIAGPQWHRIHHSVELEHRDKNFAAFFPFIDRMFGTYHRPGPVEYPATGLGAAAPDSPLVQATVGPFLGWYRNSRRRVQVAAVREGGPGQLTVEPGD